MVISTEPPADGTGWLRSPTTVMLIGPLHFFVCRLLKELKAKIEASQEQSKSTAV